MAKFGHALIRAALCVVAVVTCTQESASASELVRHPYVQNVRTDRATILWATDLPGEGILQFSRDRSFTQGIAVLSQLRTLPGFVQHQANLVDLSLQPATRYYYRIFQDGRIIAPSTPGEELSFQTAPVSAPFRFLVFGDSGTGSAAQRTLAGLMAGENASLALHTGDVVYPDGTYENFQRYYFDIYRDVMKRVPFYPTIGNHDNQVERGAPYLSLHDLPIDGVPVTDRGRYYSFDWGDVHFIALDSDSLRDLGYSERMLTWLEQDLRNTRKPWRIAYWHQSPYDPYRGTDYESTAARERFVPMLERYGVQVVFNGHYHAYARTKPIFRGQEAPPGRGIVYVITGGGGAHLHAVFTNSYTAVASSEHHYVSAEFLQGSLVLRAIRLDGSVLDTVTIAPPPAMNSVAVVNGASFAPALAPGSVISIFGQFLAPRSGSAAGFPLPDELASAQVTLNGVKLPLFFASHAQVNAQLPFDSQGAATLRITTPAGSTETPVTVSKAAPGIFNLDGTAAAIVKTDGSLISDLNPIRPGEYLTVYCTGLGRVSGPIAAGAAAPRAPLLTVVDPVQVLFEDFPVVPTFAGLAPDFVGLYQINVQVPTHVASGKVALRVVAAGAQSNIVTLAVR